MSSNEERRSQGLEQLGRRMRDPENGLDFDFSALLNVEFPLPLSSFSPSLNPILTLI